MAAGSIVVDLLMETGSFETDTKRAEKRSREMAREIDKAFKMVGVAVAAAGAAFVAMTRSIINNADSLAKASRSIGITTESLSALQYAADLSGVSSQELTSALDRLNRGAAQGNKAFEAMGIQVRNAQGNLKATDVLLKEISDKFASYADGAEKSALAQELFGRSGANMISFLNSGSKGLSDMEREAEKLGIVISGDLAANAEAFNDNLSKIALSAKGAAIEISGPLIKSLADLTTRLAEARIEGRGFWETVQRAFNPTIGAGARGSIDRARDDVQRLQAEIDDLTRRSIVRPENNAIIRDLNRQLELAKINLADLEKIQRLTAPGSPAAIAPLLSDDASARKANEDAKKERILYDQFMEQQINAHHNRAFEILERRLAREKAEYQATDDWLADHEAAQIQRALDMQDLRDARLREANDKLKRYADDLGMAFGNAFENAILTGKRLSDTLRDLANDILRLVVRQTITNPIADAISGSIGAFMGARADGGPVTGGGTYMVGERGPELFVPNTSGMIVPHEALQGGGGGVVVQQTINVTTGVQQTVRAEILTLMPQIANAAKAAVSDAKLRGGSYAAALR